MAAAQALDGADPDGHGAVNRLEWLTATNPTHSFDASQASIHLSNDVVAVTFSRHQNRGFELQWTTNLKDSLSWQFLDLRSSSQPPFLLRRSDKSAVPDIATNISAKYYRVRVYEP